MCLCVLISVDTKVCAFFQANFTFTIISMLKLDLVLSHDDHSFPKSLRKNCLCFGVPLFFITEISFDAFIYSFFSIFEACDQI